MKFIGDCVLILILGVVSFFLCLGLIISWAITIALLAIHELIDYLYLYARDSAPCNRRRQRLGSTPENY
jgi:hypothetical protein